jgi:hypothetical protein
MNRQRKLLIALPAVMLLAVVALLVWRSEPRYGGRSLTDWAIQAQDYEKLGLTDKPDYLAASNAIHRMGPAAAKTAVDWLESDTRWERSPLRPWIEKIHLTSTEMPRLDRSRAISMIVRLTDEEGRSSIEPRLLAMLIMPEHFPLDVLTNFSAETWKKIEPLILSTNMWAAQKALLVGTHWPLAQKMDLDRIWTIRSAATNERLVAFVDHLLMAQGADTNRLLEAVGTNFLRGPAGPADSDVVHIHAWALFQLGSAGRPILEAGLTNQNQYVREKAAQILKLRRPAQP